MSISPRRVVASLLSAGVSAVLVAGVLSAPAHAVAPTTAASAALGAHAAPAPGALPAAGTKKSRQRARARRVTTRTVAFDLVNNNQTSVLCRGDGRVYPVRGRLVGPRRKVDGYAGATRVNVLVHDAGTGGWFWNLRRHARNDYATAMAKKGEVSLVLDRLGYDRSPLANGRSTCLGAQATMLDQVVEHLYSGRYDYRGPAQRSPQFAQIIVHGHGTGGTIAQLQAAEFRNTSGLVLMSWSGANGASAATLSQTRRQFLSCLTGSGSASYGDSDQEYRTLLFGRASGAVQRTAVRLRNQTPCGDVASLTPAAVTADATYRDVRVPVLLLTGSEDRRVDQSAQDAGRDFVRSASVTARTIPGAGSALPLEKSAPYTRRIVKRWLDRR